MAIMKHVGRHGDKKVVVAYNTVPDEDHMCLVIYNESLPRNVATDLDNCVKSAVGQESVSLADALYRFTTGDGVNLLGVLHKGNWIKKVQTKQVILTPNAATNVRLDELNSIMAKMATGQDAIDELAAIDEGLGYASTNKEKAMNKKKQKLKKDQLDQETQWGRDVGMGPNDAEMSRGQGEAKTSSGDMTGFAKAMSEGTTPNLREALSDADLAASSLSQAKGLEAQAKSLLAEATRLKAEAKSFAPAKAKATKTKAKAKNGRTTKKATA